MTYLGKVKPVEVASSQSLVRSSNRKFPVSISFDEVLDDSARFGKRDGLSSILDRDDGTL